jgi:hypothetical protein
MDMETAGSSNANALFTILASLKAGQIYKAERMFFLLHQRNPQLGAADIHFHNNFIKAFVVHSPKPMMQHAVGWFKRLKEFKVKPNHITFSLLFRGYLRYFSHRRELHQSLT